MRYWILGLCVIFLIGLGLATDVPFVFSDNLTSVASYASDEIVEISTSSSDLDGVPKEAPPSSGSDQKEMEERVEPRNPIVRHEAALLAEKYPGDLNIEQICSIFNYLMNGDSTIKGWSYINDPRGGDYYEYANESLQIGKEGGYVGAGDCDDFAIIMSALMEAVGGTSRIIVASHDNGDAGHAFTEVYLGRDDGRDSNVECIINWLMDKFDAHKIYAHVDTDTKEVWLNLDWWADHPGGHFYEADEYAVYNIRDQFEKTPLGGCNVPQRYQSQPKRYHIQGSDYSFQGYPDGVDIPDGYENPIKFSTKTRSETIWINEQTYDEMRKRGLL